METADRHRRGAWIAFALCAACLGLLAWAVGPDLSLPGSAAMVGVVVAAFEVGRRTARVAQIEKEEL